MREIALCIHSTGTSPQLWAGVSPEILGGREVVRPANLGYPPRPFIERGTYVNVQDECAHLLRVIEDKPARVHIIAHSYGATVALGLAEIPAFRSRLASMVLFEPVLFGSLVADHDGTVMATEPQTIISARDFVATPVLLDEEKGGTAEWLEVFIDYWNRPGSWLRLPDVMKQFSLSVGWKMFLEVRACFHADKPFRDYAIDVPTTLVFGARTTAHSRAMTHALARTHDVRVIELAGAGHMAPLTHGALAQGAIAEHFAALSDAKSFYGTSEKQ